MEEPPITDHQIQALSRLASVLLRGAVNLDCDTRQGTSPPWLKQVLEIVHCQFNQTLSRSEIAEQVGVHRVYLARTFRRRFHCTIGEYQRLLRIEVACQRLTGSQASLVEIAQECGFCDQAHFSRTFKRFVGLTPLQYRANS